MSEDDKSLFASTLALLPYRNESTKAFRSLRWRLGNLAAPASAPLFAFVKSRFSVTFN